MWSPSGFMAMLVALQKPLSPLPNAASSNRYSRLQFLYSDKKLLFYLGFKDLFVLIICVCLFVGFLCFLLLSEALGMLLWMLLSLTESRGCIFTAVGSFGSSAFSKILLCSLAFTAFPKLPPLRLQRQVTFSQQGSDLVLNTAKQKIWSQRYRKKKRYDLKDMEQSLWPQKSQQPVGPSLLTSGEGKSKSNFQYLLSSWGLMNVLSLLIDSTAKSCLQVFLLNHKIWVTL